MCSSPLSFLYQPLSLAVSPSVAVSLLKTSPSPSPPSFLRETFICFLNEYALKVKRFLKVLSLFLSLSLWLRTEYVKLRYVDVFSAWLSLKPEWKRGFAFLEEGCKTHPSQRLTISNSSLFTLNIFLLKWAFSRRGAKCEVIVNPQLGALFNEESLFSSSHSDVFWKGF